jgi:spore coat protein I
VKKHGTLLSVGPVVLQGEVLSTYLGEIEEKEKVRDEAKNHVQVADQDEIDAETSDVELTPEMREKLTLLAGDIIKSWNVHVESIEVVQGGQMALVWKVMTSEGPKCLKRIHRPEKKALFSIHAQHYLAEKAYRVPAIIKTNNGELFAKHGPFLFVVYDWIEGRQFNMNVPEDLAWIMKGLAEYHQHSAGYTPPEGIPPFSKLGQWPKHYIKRCLQMESWKLIAEQEPNDPFSKRYLETIDEFIESGRTILQELNSSYYPEWVTNSKKNPTLCHQDYGTGNTLLRDNEVWIIDLDTTAYDLPIRDLRKMIIPAMEDQGTWRQDVFDQMLGGYESVNPLTNEQKKVMFIDMKFHYELYDVCRDKYSLKNNVAPEELAKAIEFERLKSQEMNKMIENL